MTHMNCSSSKTAIAAAHAALSTLVIATPETAIDRHVGAAEVPHAVYSQPTLVVSGILAGAGFTGRIIQDSGSSFIAAPLSA